MTKAAVWTKAQSLVLLYVESTLKLQWGLEHRHLLYICSRYICSVLSQALRKNIRKLRQNIYFDSQDTVFSSMENVSSAFSFWLLFLQKNLLVGFIYHLISILVVKNKIFRVLQVLKNKIFSRLFLYISLPLGRACYTLLIYVSTIHMPGDTQQGQRWTQLLSTSRLLPACV